MATAKNPKSSVPTVSISISVLVAEVSSKFSEVPKKMTKDILLSFLQIIETHISSGTKVRIDKLGILKVKDRAARVGHNPQTGKAIAIPASKKVVFRVASSLKERVVGIKNKKAGKLVANKKVSATKPAPKKKKAA